MPRQQNYSLYLTYPVRVVELRAVPKPHPGRARDRGHEHEGSRGHEMVPRGLPASGQPGHAGNPGQHELETE